VNFHVKYFFMSKFRPVIYCKYSSFQNINIFTRWIRVESVKSFLERLQSHHKRLYTVPYTVIFRNLAISAVAKIDVNNFFGVYLFERPFLPLKDLFNQNCFVGRGSFSDNLPSSFFHIHTTYRISGA
jgi:hypothetical protein